MDVRSKNPGKPSRTAAGVNEPDCCINKGPLFLSVDPEAGFAKAVIPAKAGIHFNHENPWIPAFAGMTGQDDH